jgi:transcription elongation GreA/GreB family factor
MKPTIQIAEAEYHAMRDELERLRGQVRLLRHQLKVAQATISKQNTQRFRERQQQRGAA